jgi:hypothetical protein
MSQVTQPRISLPTSRPAVIGAALAAVALAAVILVLALSSGSSDETQPASVGAQPSLRSDGGPEESHVAVAAGSHQAIAAPSESNIAASIATPGPSSAASGPDESHTAAAIGGR